MKASLSKRFTPIILAIFLLPPAAPSAATIDWRGVQGKPITLFYPGQASWEWALTKADHSGATKFRQGKNCMDCHNQEEQEMGNKIVAGEKLEPHPSKSKRGAISLNVKTAHDGERLYIRLEWPAAEGDQGPKMGPEIEQKTEARVTMMFDDGHVKAATRAGCWGTCHDDAAGMASAPASKAITKYLAASRTKVTRSGGGENYKSQTELDQLLADGQFMEFWQIKLNRGQEPVAVDGYVLDKRHENKAPLVEAEARFQDGAWSVVLSRKMNAADPKHKNIVPGKTYTLGFAIHDAYAEHRFHHISFEHTLVLDKGEADFVAVKQ